jgi:predicted amidohydrolase
MKSRDVWDAASCSHVKFDHFFEKVTERKMDKVSVNCNTSVVGFVPKSNKCVER